MRITHLTAIEILDSRGHPTVQTTLTDHAGRVFVAGVPAGAPTGSREAVELRDGDPDRYAGLGAQKACGQLKSGAPARGERVAKYNRLTEIAGAEPDLAFGLGR